jgi:hypothetical protein
MTDAEAAATLQRILGKGWKVEPIQTYPTELTPIGEQLVIPDCERQSMTTEEETVR